jgi:hypothetical protein
MAGGAIMSRYGHSSWCGWPSDPCDCTVGKQQRQHRERKLEQDMREEARRRGVGYDVVLGEYYDRVRRSK